MSASSPLELQHVAAGYPGLVLIPDVSFSLPVGVLGGIIGPNGAGKSTLLKTALGLLPCQAGKVLFWGQPFVGMRNRVAYIPQRTTVDWDFPATVRDVVTMGTFGRLKWFQRVGRIERDIVQKSLEQLQIEPLADCSIGELSGGQQQRVFLARALAQQAELYLLDEPFQGIDAITEELIWSLLHGLVHRGKTVMMIHHDLSQITEHFDWLLMLKRELFFAGPVHEVWQPEKITQVYGGLIPTWSSFTQKEQNP